MYELNIKKGEDDSETGRYDKGTRKFFLVFMTDKVHEGEASRKWEIQRSRDGCHIKNQNAGEMKKWDMISPKYIAVNFKQIWRGRGALFIYFRLHGVI